MDTHTQKKFFGEMKQQCQFALFAYQEAMEKLKSADRTNFQFNIHAFWFFIQTFLVSYANISKILWSPQGNPRGEELRKILDIPDSSVFHYKYRSFRNHFEHIDERFDEWALKTVDGNFADYVIGMQKLTGWEDKSHFRFFKDNKLYFWEEESLELPIIVKEISDLRQSL